MKEIGGYIELDTFKSPMLHENAIALNCGRNALAYIIEARGITSICLPYFLCDSVRILCEKYDVSIRYYHINEHFEPEVEAFKDDEWLYVVNYYGQISHEKQRELVKQFDRVIIDNAQAYFEQPLERVDTLYTCRKYFGVSDGAILYTNAKLDRVLPIDESFERVHYILGRYERSAGEFFAEASANNDFFENEPIKEMSKLTRNLLRAVDYQAIKNQRKTNFEYLHSKLSPINLLNLCVIDGAFMYPLMVENAPIIKKNLAEKHIFIPTLWPNVLTECMPGWLEWKLTNNILPIPVDQRYTTEDMNYVAEEVLLYFD